MGLGGMSVTVEDASVVIEDPSVVAVGWLAGGKPLQPDNSTIRAWHKNDLGIDFAQM